MARWQRRGATILHFVSYYRRLWHYIGHMLSGVHKRTSQCPFGRVLVKVLIRWCWTKPCFHPSSLLVLTFAFLLLSNFIYWFLYFILSVAHIPSLLCLSLHVSPTKRLYKTSVLFRSFIHSLIPIYCVMQQRKKLLLRNTKKRSQITMVVTNK
jgi:hypothetical protein